MLTRRIATFLIGAWLGCGILVSILVLQNPGWAEHLLTDPSDGAKVLFTKIGESDARLVMDYVVSEQNRSYLSTWENAQMVIAVGMVVILALSSQRRFLPIAMVCGMLGLVLFQHLGVTPELMFRGRQADFLPEESAFSVAARLRTLTQIYAGAEAVKLLLGGVLASYFFAATAGTRVRKRKRGRGPQSASRSSIEG